ncbi:NACHT domain-containing protein [Acinetobacter guillouiae]|uniref:NACHT domain-containing protein n=1 Tax=Acinetobacter guillouiae TaxID=106649 RepID=UPI002090D628|nr:NACHT domain-containing protein [Acinetobacter guillouiae]
MTLNFYLPRKLYDHEKEYTEFEVKEAFQIIIILAEPGAGKTSLLENFSNHLNVKRKTANSFNSRNNHSENSILIIDALDELVRIDQSAVSNLLGKAADLEPQKLIISSRSSEWEESYTRLVRDIFEIEPRVFRLFPFNESEQQQIFENYKTEENFKIFESEVKKYNLKQLLSNPQFLKIFAEAYIESDRVFIDRKSIFRQAVKALAKETNNVFNVRNDLPLLKKIESTEEIFAKLLLSGSEGVSTNVDGLDTLYPRIDSLIRLDNTDLYPSLLSSRLLS